MALECEHYVKIGEEQGIDHGAYLICYYGAQRGALSLT